MQNKIAFKTVCNNVRRFGASLAFVPKHHPVSEVDVQALRNFVAAHDKILIVTGAGISTESGIPDYRSEEVGLYARTNHRPIQYMEFLKSAQARQRYWARNYIGWPRFSRTEPNDTHYAIRNLETVHKKLTAVVTQNVDSLHYKAGSRNVVELHGSAFRVVCLNCKNVIDRHELQDRLETENPEMRDTSEFVRPDGDVDITDDQVKGFKTPECLECGGVLKPDIVFFGDNVPRKRVELVNDYVDRSDSILVLGSSLSVFSGYRIILQAVDSQKPVAVVNIGPTRADGHVQLKIVAKCGDVLPKVLDINT